jgi:hypothetical protein
MARRLRFWAILMLVIFAPMIVAHRPGSKSALTPRAGTVRKDQEKQKRKYDLNKYFRMANPKEAAQQMVRDAEADGIDVDRTPQNWFEPTPVDFPSGPENPKMDNREFLRRVAQDTILTPVGESEAICFFQCRRTMSVREWSTILSLGVKIYSTLGGGCFIARMPISQIEVLAEQPAIGWCDFYLPRYKYRHDLPAGEDVSFLIHSLAGRSAEFMSDLTSVGVVVESSWPGGYQVRMPTSSVEKIAQLWWVKEIYPSQHSEPEETPDVKNAEIESSESYHNVKFKPQDSRKLVSAPSIYMPSHAIAS